MRRLSFGYIAVTTLAAAAAFAAAPPSHQQLLLQERPLYDQVRQDVRIAALLDAVTKAPGDKTTLDAYLRAMPLSPLDYREIDMFVRHYELEINRELFAWHERWIQLHATLAAERYPAPDITRALEDGAAALGAGENGRTPDADVSANHDEAYNFGSPPTEYQGEIQVAANPHNLNQVVAMANTWDTGGCTHDTQAVFYSSDGGANWGYTCAPDNAAYTSLGLPAPQGGFSVFGSDPAVYWDDAGNVYLNYMLIETNNSVDYVAIVVAKSTNGGSTYGAQGIVTNGWSAQAFNDKNIYVIDRTPASPFYERQYTCWDLSNDEQSAWSSDNGATWHIVNLPATGGGGSRFDLGCEMTVAKNGTVYVVYNTLTCPSTCNAESIYVSKSTDGGVTWSSPVSVRTLHLVGFSTDYCPTAVDNRCIEPNASIDVDNSGGPCDGDLYVAFTDDTSTSNDSDIYFTRSTNGGTSWSTAFKVNMDGIANRVQFHPWLQVDQRFGNPVVVWHDARNDAANKKIDYFMAESFDCGQHVGFNQQLTAASNEFNNNTVTYTDENTTDHPARNPNQYGEYMGLAVTGGKAFVSWTDSRQFYPVSSGTQKENLGFVSVTLPIFQDGFESNSTVNWSVSVP